MIIPQFNHEKLIVYRLALDFITWLTPVLQETRKKSASESAIARDHLDRASLSVLYNIAEGNGKFSIGSRNTFFDIALGSYGLRNLAQPATLCGLLLSRS